jgi:hypothetical protein
MKKYSMKKDLNVKGRYRSVHARPGVCFLRVSYTEHDKR